MKAGFESSSRKTPEFVSFSRLFKKAITRELNSIGATLTDFNTGYFYVSGFFRKDGKCYYFSLSDVRHFANSDLLYRTAKDEKDFTGGHNQYVKIEDGMAYNMRLN